MAKANGRKPRQEIVPAGTGMLPDLDRLTPEERERINAAYVAGAGAAAAIQAQHEMENVNVKEFYGVSPTDLRREFTTLPKPAQGGSRRPSERVLLNGNTGSSAR